MKLILVTNNNFLEIIKVIKGLNNSFQCSIGRVVNFSALLVRFFLFSVNALSETCYRLVHATNNFVVTEDMQCQTDDGGFIQTDNDSKTPRISADVITTTNPPNQRNEQLYEPFRSPNKMINTYSPVSYSNTEYHDTKNILLPVPEPAPVVNQQNLMSMRGLTEDDVRSQCTRPEASMTSPRSDTASFRSGRGSSSRYSSEWENSDSDSDIESDEMGQGPISVDIRDDAH